MPVQTHQTIQDAPATRSSQPRPRSQTVFISGCRRCSPSPLGRVQRTAALPFRSQGALDRAALDREQRGLATCRASRPQQGDAVSCSASNCSGRTSWVLRLSTSSMTDLKRDQQPARCRATGLSLCPLGRRKGAGEVVRSSSLSGAFPVVGLLLTTSSCASFRRNRHVHAISRAGMSRFDHVTRGQVGEWLFSRRRNPARSLTAR